MRKPTPIQLHIPAPCAENWDSMSPAEKGHHCKQCATIVTDFSKMSDSDIIDFLSKGKGSGCGRFKTSQMNRSIQKDLPVKRYGQGFFPALFSAALSVLIHQSGTAQDQAVKSYSSVHVSPNSEENKAEDETSSPKSLAGIVIDEETKTGIPFANVRIEGTEIGTVTDFDGNFEIKIPEGMTLNEIVLVAESLGYESISLCPQRTTDLNLTLSIGPMVTSCRTAVFTIGMFATQEPVESRKNRIRRKAKNTLLFPFRWVSGKLAR